MKNRTIKEIVVHRLFGHTSLREGFGCSDVSFKGKWWQWRRLGTEMETLEQSCRSQHYSVLGMRAEGHRDSRDEAPPLTNEPSL
jgi:hypothetical protein